MRQWHVVLFLLCVSAPGFAAEPETCARAHALADDALAVAGFDDLRRAAAAVPVPAGAQLRAIRYVRQNVFPDEDYWLARQANRFNFLTSRRALGAALPFAEGDRVSAAEIAEAERILRAKPYLYDAVILVRERCPDGVALDVVTRDVWTLTPGIGVSRSGGDNETSASLADVNFLGTGKSLSLEVFDDRDRSGAFVSYTDPNVSGSRWAGRLVAAENDDGQRYSVSLTRPFFSLDTRFALGLQASHFVREQDLEFLGEDRFELDAETDAASVFVARSGGRDGGWIHRQFLGYRFLDEVIEFPAAFPGATRIERRFAYPYVGWQWFEDRFEERTDLRRVGVTEDVQLGWSSYAELGWSSDDTGGDGEYVLARGTASYRRFVRNRHLLSVSAELQGRYDLDRNRSEDVLAEVTGTLLWEQAPRWRFATSVRYVHTENLPLDRQLTLGGDTGLRGYPSRYQPGDRSFLVTLEQRYYSGARVFGLLRVGYAAFLDVGRAWFDDEAPTWLPPRDGDHFDTLANVGFGLRLESIRTRRDRVFHIDIARPLVDGPEVKTWEITLSGKQRF